ncbi:ankyrin repeat domain-containing protein [Polymorphospora sp. NPDC050346]|uniref:ankyrin repeat domain-containing protein n=1 Tax=Polymorphospora sp. NPDC050346 TaxID=3155780 RepID=UPI003401D747
MARASTYAPGIDNRRRKKYARRLVEAALTAETRTVARLLRAGADPDAPDRDGTTPLYVAAVQNSGEAVRLLLTAGAAPDLESGHGDQGTPLCAAASWGHVDVVRELLAHGADPDRREDHGTGRSPLDWAVRGGHTEVADLLLVARRETSGATATDGRPGHG